MSKLHNLLIALAVLSAGFGMANPVGQDRELADLGARLFQDTRLSIDGQVACSTCHQHALAFADGRALPVGAQGRTGTRNAPSLLDVGRQRSLFWDGRRVGLEAQAIDPLLNPAEHGLADETMLLARVRDDTAYVQRFGRVFGDGGANGGPEPGAVTVPRMAQALAAFQRTLVSAPNPLDRHLAGQSGALSQAAQRGWALFTGAADCTRCHLAPGVDAGGATPLFTDHGFHSLQVGMDQVARHLPQLTAQVLALRAQGGAALDHALTTRPDLAALGRFVVTLEPADIGKFKTPGLRNVALTAPYMHDGSIATLDEAVEREVFYRGTRSGSPLVLTPAERADLVAFLREGLTSPQADSPAPLAAGQSR